MCQCLAALELGKLKNVGRKGDAATFLPNIYHPYIQGVVDHINQKGSTDLIAAMSVFDPHYPPDMEDKLLNYDVVKILELIDFYGVL